MNKSFVYGKSVEGENFTDRVKETRRLRENFLHGLNTIIISPRRWGKTSLVKRAKQSIDNPAIKVVLMDVYDCRSEYDFLNRFASVILKETAEGSDRVVSYIKEFLVRLTPKLSFNADPFNDISISLGITPKNYAPEEILNLPEVIAKKKGIDIVVCIDEFQQVGEFPDSLGVQKRMRGVWQHQQNVSYCLFGSRRHMMIDIFQSKRMPFYQFGDTVMLGKIDRQNWVDFIVSRYEKEGKRISIQFAERICDKVECHSSYVQQLAGNVLMETKDEVTEDCFEAGCNTLLEQNTALFESQISDLTSLQMNFLRAVCNGISSDFASKKVSDEYDFGTKSNIARIKAALIKKELIDIENGKVIVPDPVFRLWFLKFVR